MSYKNYQWKVVATDYNSSLFRHYIAIKALFRYPEELDLDRFLIAIISRNDNIEYVTDMKNWENIHRQLKEKSLADVNFVEKLIDRSHREGERFNEWARKNIFVKDLSKKTNQELLNLLEQFTEKQGLLYVLGTALPILDFADFSFLEGWLNNYLKERCDIAEQNEYYAVFTEPIANSFAQDQEEELLKIMAGNYNNKQWIEDIKNQPIDYIEKHYPKFYKDLQKHTDKHTWVYYAYNGPQTKLTDFLQFIKDYLLRDQNPQELLEQINEKKKNISQKKEKFFVKYHPSVKDKKMLHLIGKFVWGKPRRKDYQSKSYYYVRSLQLEFAKRLNLSLDQMRSTPFAMLKMALLEKKEIDNKIINTIKKFHIVAPNDDGTVSILTGQEAEDFNKQVDRPYRADYKDTKEISGAVAFLGKAYGVVKIINTVSDMSKMAYGDILISAQTSPSIIAAMKKAAAFVTDEGGLTCHAAIVSREMSKPCVVGTKIATQVFKDGDRVEVDADKGIVRKI